MRWCQLLKATTGSAATSLTPKCSPPRFRIGHFQAAASTSLSPASSRARRPRRGLLPLTLSSSSPARTLPHHSTVDTRHLDPRRLLRIHPASCRSAAPEVSETRSRSRRRSAGRSRSTTTVSLARVGLENAAAGGHRKVDGEGRWTMKATNLVQPARRCSSTSPHPSSSSSPSSYPLPPPRQLGDFRR